MFFQDIPDCCFYTLCIIQPALAATLSPPIFPDNFRARCSFVILEFSRTPGLELAHNIVRCPPNSRYDHMNVLVPSCDCVKLPVANPAMFRNGVFDYKALFDFKCQCVFCHPFSSCVLTFKIWESKFTSLVNPVAFIAWQPRAIGGPCQKVGQCFFH